MAIKITVLDGYTLNPGDLSWAGLEALGQLEVFDRTPPERIVERARDSELVLTNKTPLSAGTIERLPKLRYIGVLATGYDVVDAAAARSRGIPVANVPTYGTQSVAQHVFALILALSNQTGVHAESVGRGDWSDGRREWTYRLAPITELAGKTLGIVGFGRIGAKTAAIAQAFGMNVAVYSRTMSGGAPLPGASWRPLDELLAESDIVSLHCPLTPQTEGLIRRETLARMKRTAFLINTSRGKLIVEEDLAEALREGRIAGAGLDVLRQEPPVAGSPLIGAPNCIITPHLAWASREARSRLLDIATDNVRAFLSGRPVNLVGEEPRTRAGSLKED